MVEPSARRGGRAPSQRQPGLAAAARTAPSRCSAPAPRSGRCPRCCAGAPRGRGRPAPAGIWERVLGAARQRRHGCIAAGAPATTRDRWPSGPAPTCVAEVPAVADWLAGRPAALVLGNYVYADGATNVRVSVGRRRADRAGCSRPATTWRWASWPPRPTSSPCPPRRSARRSAAYAEPLGGAPSCSAGRCARCRPAGCSRRSYPPGADPGVNDSLVPQQGPNYALAKRLQRWRAAVARRRRGDRLAQRRAADPDPVGA